MENQFQSVAPPEMPHVLAIVVVSFAIAVALRFFTRFFLLRKIERDGFHDPQLQALHMRELEKEKGKLFTHTRSQLFFAIGWAAVSMVLVWLLWQPLTQ